MADRLTLVLAGDYGEYSHWRRLHPEINAIYVCMEDEIRGRQDVNILKIGNWWENPLAENGYFKMLEARIKSGGRE